MKKNVNKRGFNLIEIAIVLAVIGLVIGGIYVAASSVTENQRKQKAQSQLLTIVQNMRSAYANQVWTTAAPTPTVLYSSHIMPADVIPDATPTPTLFNGAFGTVAIGAPSITDFSVTLAGVPQSACIDMIAKNFGTASQVSQIGLVSIKAGAAGTTAVATPYTVANAGAVCAVGANIIAFEFTVH